MKKTFAFLLSGIFLVILVYTPAHCLTAKEIVAKMIEAQGGQKSLEKIKDMTVTGTLELITFGMSGPMTLYQKEPNKLRIDSELMGMIFTQAHDGATAWWTNPQTGSSEEMPDQMAKDFKRKALDNDSTLHPEKYGITFNYKGKEKIEDKEYLVLEQIYSDGYKMTMYVDPNTYLTYKIKAMTLNEMGVEVETETYLTDYKKVEGIMVAHSRKTLMEGAEYTKITIEKVSFNKGIEDSFFKMSV